MGERVSIHARLTQFGHPKVCPMVELDADVSDPGWEEDVAVTDNPTDDEPLIVAFGR